MGNEYFYIIVYKLVRLSNKMKMCYQRCPSLRWQSKVFSAPRFSSEITQNQQG